MPQIRSSYLAATAILVGAIGPLAQAQQTQAEKPLVLNHATPEQAMQALLAPLHVPYHILPGIKGAVTATFQNPTFETVLTEITTQLNANYRIVAGEVTLYRSKITP